MGKVNWIVLVIFVSGFFGMWGFPDYAPHSVETITTTYTTRTYAPTWNALQWIFMGMTAFGFFWTLFIMSWLEKRKKAVP